MFALGDPRPSLGVFFVRRRIGCAMLDGAPPRDANNRCTMLMLPEFHFLSSALESTALRGAIVRSVLRRRHGKAESRSQRSSLFLSKI